MSSAANSNSDDRKTQFARFSHIRFFRRSFSGRNCLIRKSIGWSDGHVCSLLVYVFAFSPKLSSFGCDKIHGACNARHRHPNETKWNKMKKKKNCDEQISSKVMSIIRQQQQQQEQRTKHWRSTVSRRKIRTREWKNEMKENDQAEIAKLGRIGRMQSGSSSDSRIWKRRRAWDEINVVWTYKRRIESTERERKSTKEKI